MTEHQQLEQAIAVQEGLRGAVPDAVIDATIAALQDKLAALGHTQRDEQRKLVTVLFADLAGFTAIAERMDPEDVRELQDTYFAAVTQPIESYGGSVEKYIGDAVLAVFGVPQAHEDDAERAVRAALAALEAVASLSPARLQLRIGVHSGLVVSRVDEAGDFVVTGDTVNLASRLQNAAEPGTVLISADTYLLVAQAFATEDLGAIQVKGKAEPVHVFRVTGSKAVPAKRRGLAGLDSPLVGRQAEFAAVQEALERLKVGVGGIVTIVGKAGMGKSRLVAEIRKSTNRKRTDPQWVEGRCLSYGSSIAYLLWLDVLRSALGQTLDDPPAAVRNALRQWIAELCPNDFDAVYPYLGQLLALPLEPEAAAKLADLDGPELKRRTYSAVDTALTCAANRKPLAIVCEDLHWADPSSLELLEHILALTDKTGLLVMCVFRANAEHGSWRLRELAARHYHHRHTDLWLQPLSAGESETLVSNLLGAGLSSASEGSKGVPTRLIYRILGQAEGNPFYVEEVLRTLIDTGAIVHDDLGRWQITQDVADLAIPDTLQGVLVARIDRLQDDTKRVLQLASVIGRVFLHRVLAAIAQEERDLDDMLLALQRHELIRERARIPELEFIFKHELTARRPITAS